MANLWLDFRTGLHALLRRPFATMVVIATLALGIGANTAIFSLLNAIVLRPLPVPHPEQLVAMATTIADDVNGDQPLSVAMFQEIARSHIGLTDVFALDSARLTNFEVNGRNVAAALASVSGSYYQAMRIAPVLGRVIRTLLFGVSPADPAILASALLTLLIVALLASLLPARRAASLDPMQALRVE